MNRKGFIKSVLLGVAGIAITPYIVAKEEYDVIDCVTKQIDGCVFSPRFIATDINISEELSRDWKVIMQEWNGSAWVIIHEGLLSNDLDIIKYEKGLS